MRYLIIEDNKIANVIVARSGYMHKMYQSDIGQIGEWFINGVVYSTVGNSVRSNKVITVEKFMKHKSLQDNSATTVALLQSIDKEFGTLQEFIANLKRIYNER